jgi:hypothetical protein
MDMVLNDTKGTDRVSPVVVGQIKPSPFFKFSAKAKSRLDRMP